MSARCSSIAASVASASKRGSTTTWLPASSAWHDQTAGPLWYSGPGITRHPSSVSSSGGGSSGSSCAGSPDTISFGRPVDPPDVGAFHAGDVGVGQRAVVQVVGRLRSRPAGSPVPSSAPGSTPSTTLAAGEVDDVGELAGGQLGRHRLRDGAQLPAGDVGDEPVDRVGQRDRDEVAVLDAAPGEVAGQAVGTTTPAHRDVTDASPQVTAVRSGAAAARSARRRGNETIAMASVCRDGISPNTGIDPNLDLFQMSG